MSAFQVHTGVNVSLAVLESINLCKDLLRAPCVRQSLSHMCLQVYRRSIANAAEDSLGPMALRVGLVTGVNTKI